MRQFTRTIGLTFLALSTLAIPTWAQNQGNRVRNSIREAGVVEAAASIELRSQLPGQATIVWVIPEGTVVKEGDVVVKFDSAPLEEQLSQQQIEMSKSHAAVLAAKSDLSVAKLELESTRKVFQLRTKLIDLEREAILGELELKRAEAESAIRIHEVAIDSAQEEIKRLAAKESSSGELKEKLITSREMLSVAQRRLKYLSEVEMAKAMATHELTKTQHELESRVQISKAERNLILSEAQLAAAAQTHSRNESRISQLNKQMQSCQMMAPRAGTVIHANQARSRTGGGATIRAGAVVRERQPILRLPDLSQLQIRTRVNETHISRVRKGQTARIVLDAMPDQNISGVVTSIARAARPTSFLASDVKEYDVIVRITKAPALARVGMSAMVEIRSSDKESR